MAGTNNALAFNAAGAMYSLERLGGNSRLVTVTPGGVVAEASVGVTTTIGGLAAIAFITPPAAPGGDDDDDDDSDDDDSDDD